MMVAVGSSLSRTTPSSLSRMMGDAGTTWSSYCQENCRWEDQQPTHSHQLMRMDENNKSISDSILTLRTSIPLTAGILYGNHDVAGVAATTAMGALPTSGAVLTQSTEAVSELLSTIAERCQQQQATQAKDVAMATDAPPEVISPQFSSAPPTSASPSTPLPPTGDSVVAPEQECNLLAQWAAMDTHYRVVIAALGGIPKLVTTMRLFSDDAGLQTAGCTAIENICQRNGSNQLAVFKSGGVDVIVKSMRNHPQSITVQSAAIGALRCLNAIIMLHVIPSNKIMAMELVWLLQHAKKMYITSTSRESLDFLLTQLRWS